MTQSVLDSVQKTRLTKAFREMRSGPGYYDIKRFFLAESAKDQPEMMKLVSEVVELFRGLMLEEAETAMAVRR